MARPLHFLGNDTVDVKAHSVVIFVVGVVIICKVATFNILAFTVNVVKCWYSSVCSLWLC